MDDYNMAMNHEFLPKHTPEYLVDGNPEFRKRARNAISQAVRSFLRNVEGTENAQERCSDAVRRFVDVILTYFMDNAIPEYRIGGLIGLASAAIALENYLDDHIDAIIKLVLPYFTDQDSTVRYYACESLFNIIKKGNHGAVRNFSDIFDGVCKVLFSMTSYKRTQLCCDEDDDVRQTSQFMNRLLREIMLDDGGKAVEQIVDLIASRLYVTNSYVRILLISWITALNALPGVNMLKHVPKVYVGLFNMLVDHNKDVRGAAELCLAEFLGLFKRAFTAKIEIVSDELFNVILMNMSRNEYTIKRTNIGWVRELACLQPHIIHFDGFPLLLKSIIMSIADKNGDVSTCAQEANKQLFLVAKEQRTIANVERLTQELVAILGVYINQVVMLTVLQWLTLLLELKPRAMNDIAPVVTKAVVSCFKQSDSELIMEATIRAIVLVIGLGSEHFELVSQQLLELFKTDEALLEERGNRIIINVCNKIGFENFYRITANCLAHETDRNFLQRVVYTLNWTLLTSEDAREMRAFLLTESGQTLGTQLQACWEHNLASALALALWREKYDLACNIVERISESNLGVEFWLWMDSIVQLLDSHVFMKMRLHLLQPIRHRQLLQALLGLSMILPQSETNKQLMRRLSISQFTQIEEQLMKMNAR
ncbi:HEAT repeat containing protein [Babesia ovis]|uniref:HEAT repeat containing protein n=1 Tax=Babesia ovis TaxID=5869 RepID=A0A9W5TES4_BABOV|nr:HEAT repeat containing protein [Babesia ovis]